MIPGVRNNCISGFVVISLYFIWCENTQYFLYTLRCRVYACVRRWGDLYLSAQGMTKHGDRCPSPMGVKSVYDGVGIDSREMYAY